MQEHSDNNKSQKILENSLTNNKEDTRNNESFVTRTICKLFKKRNNSILEEIHHIISNDSTHSSFKEEKNMISNIINVNNSKVSDIMIPRTDIIAIPENIQLAEIKNLILEEEHTRIPVYKDNLDKITGFIHCKDLIKFIGEVDINFKLDDIIRKIIYIPNSMRVFDLLIKMRFLRVHIAIVLDEYGGTDGLVTIENIMEEIVGEIEDEHDLPDDNIYLKIEKIDDHTLNVGGRIEIDKIEQMLNHVIIEDKSTIDYDTVGGLILSNLKKIPVAGEKVNHESGVSFKVLDADARSIKLVEIIKKQDSQNN